MNIIIGHEGHARLTEYELAPISSDPTFTVLATMGAIGMSRWLAPEIMTPSCKGSATWVTESKAADVYAFVMLAVEVSTGKIPFEEQRDEAVILHVLQSGRPEVPQNTHESDLAPEMCIVTQELLAPKP